VVLSANPACSPTTVVDVTNPITGKTWMDRNLGASQAATSSTDAASYGDLFQWGRGCDGHQFRTTTSSTILLSFSDEPGHSDFIISGGDWRGIQNDNLWQGLDGINNPCPAGYRVPTVAELNNERLSWTTNGALGAFASPLKWPNTGFRQYNAEQIAIYGAGTYGTYWSSTPYIQQALFLYFYNYDGEFANRTNSNRGDGRSVRCIKD
jgi:uncharacterized protein (TIGR02145 family)